MSAPENFYPFKEGDVVQLKSGGPNMVVEHIEGLNTVTVSCAFFSERCDVVQREAFPLAVLIASPQKESANQ